jgi:hypothetical protein
LKSFSGEMNNEREQWCIDTLRAVIMEILQTTFHPRYDFHPTYNIMEKERALTSFHLIVNRLESEDQSELIATIICVLFAPFAEYEVRYITTYFRSVFFKECPEFMQRIWSGLIKYAKFKKENPHRHYQQSQEEIEANDQKEQDFIKDLTTTDNLAINISEIDFNTYACYILIRALMITPFDPTNNSYKEFIKQIIPLILQDLQLETNYSYNREKDERQMSYEQETDVKYYFADFFLNSEGELSKSVVDILTSDVLKEQPQFTRYRRHDPAEFLTSLFEQLIYKLDTYIANSTDESHKKLLTDNFWIVWQHLFELAKANGGHHFVKTILFDIDWKKDSVSWHPFEGKSGFYQTMVTNLGKGYCASLIKVFSTAGEKEFLPQGLSWLVNILKANTHEEIALINPAGERLVKRLYANHISVIKKNQTLIGDFLYLLNKMVGLGSSPAYFFRENVITYKAMA